MNPLNYLLRKYTGGYKLSKSKEKVNLQMYSGDIKLFVKHEKELETLIQVVKIYSQDIGMEFYIESSSMLMMKSGNWHISKGMELPN